MSCPPINNCAPTLNTSVTACTPTPAKCFYYSGDALPCTGINFNDTVDVALQKIDTKICLIASNQIVTSSTKAVFIQCLIGDPSSILIAGDDQLVISEPTIAQDSVWVSGAGGGELPRGLTDRQSYGVTYSSAGATINFFQAVVDGELYIIHYLFNNASAYNVEFKRIDFLTGSPQSLIVVGASTLTITDDSIIPSSLEVIVGGENLPNNSNGNFNSQFNYIPTFNGTNTVLTFNNAATVNQAYIITYAKIINGTVYTPPV